MSQQILFLCLSGVNFSPIKNLSPLLCYFFNWKVISKPICVNFGAFISFSLPYLYYKR